MHQGSALSPLLFVIVMETLCREFTVTLPWEYADDLVVVAETEDDLIKRLNEWKDFLENRGMRVNMNKTTKVMISREQQKVRCCKMVMLCIMSHHPHLTLSSLAQNNRTHRIQDPVTYI